MSKQEKRHIIKEIIENSDAFEIGMGFILISLSFCAVALTVLIFIVSFTK